MAATGSNIRSIKISYLDEIRRLPLQTLKAMTAEAPSSPSSLESLKNIVVKTFPALEGREFALKYTDDEKDLITVKTDGA